MEFKDLVVVSGKPGIFKIVKTSDKGLIIESLEDKKRIPVFIHDQISSLEEISIYTDEDDMMLKEIFHKMLTHEDKQELIDAKLKKLSNDQLSDLFGKFIPEYDDERVYPSHIKKMVRWFQILDQHNLLDLTIPKEEEETTTEETTDKKEEEKK